MKRSLSFAAGLSLFILLGVGCTNASQEQTPPTPTEPQKTTTSSTPEQTSAAPILYRGAWFDIKYPKNFTASPTTPTFVSDNGNTRVKTDEAKFVSPDGNIEFFVFSPLWGGNPIEYLNIKNTEELVSEKTTTTTNANSDKKITTWVTIKAKDGSYYRSFVSITDGVGSGSQVHHVLGLQYKNEAAYEKYKNDYLKFKASLMQYSD